VTKLVEKQYEKNAEKSIKVDDKEIKIMRELIKDPRISDNQIAKNTKIPLKTVNRKRKRLEEKNILYYFVSVNNREMGTDVFRTIQSATIYFDYGVGRKQIIDILTNDAVIHDPVWKKHIFMDWVGEKDAHATYHCIIESRVGSDIVEIINLEIIPKFQHALGKECIKNVELIPNVTILRAMHNYMPQHNMRKGKLGKSTPDSNIFVT
jgi:DNA-binding Lrp family transcriptional regulator